MLETWKEVIGYDGRYSVSTLGNVRSNDYTYDYFWRGKWITMNRYAKPLKPEFSGGYLCVVLRKNKQSNKKLIHRLVAETFLSNPNNYTVVNHIDGNKFNNCIENLEWCTQSYNIKHALDIGLGKLPNPGHLIKCIETGEIYDSQTAAGRALGVYQATIRKSIIYNRAVHGFHFIEI